MLMQLWVLEQAMGGSDGGVYAGWHDEAVSVCQVVAQHKAGLLSKPACWHHVVAHGLHA